MHGPKRQLRIRILKQVFTESLIWIMGLTQDLEKKKQLLVDKIIRFSQTEMVFPFLCSRIDRSAAYSFWPVRLSVCPFVCLFVLKNFYIGYIFWLVRLRAFMFNMSIPCDKNLGVGTKFKVISQGQISRSQFSKKRKNGRCGALVFHKHNLLTLKCFVNMCSVCLKIKMEIYITQFQMIFNNFRPHVCPSVVCLSVCVCVCLSLSFSYIVSTPINSRWEETSLRGRRQYVTIRTCIHELEHFFLYPDVENFDKSIFKDLEKERKREKKKPLIVVITIENVLVNEKKKSWEKEKMLILSIFFFSHDVLDSLSSSELIRKEFIWRRVNEISMFIKK